MRVVLVSPEQSANVGAIARVMANFGYTELVLVNSQCEIDADAIKQSKHASSLLERARHTSHLEEAVADTFVIGTTGTTGKYYTAFSPQAVAHTLQHSAVSFVFGRESTGLSKAELAVCDTIVHIPTAHTYPVMNISHAVAILLYEVAAAQSSTALSQRHGGKEQRTLEKTFKSLLDTLDYPAKEHERVFATLRSAFAQSLLSSADVHTAIGFFKKLAKRIE